MTNTVDKREIEQFSSLSNKWWDMSGPFSALHKMSNARIEFIKQNSTRIFKKNNIGVNLLDGLNCLDIGCGGGILSEKLSRLGANVTGIDASKISIDIAKEHAKKSRLEINYKCITTSELLKIKNVKFHNKFDLIIASEIIEHVEDISFFLKSCSKLLKKNGLMFVATINKTLKSYVFAIVGADYVL